MTRAFIFCLVLLNAAAADAAPAAPDWVKNAKTERFPSRTHLTGVGFGATAAKAQRRASAALARRIRVRVQQTSIDHLRESTSNQAFETAITTVATSDVRIVNLAFETFVARDKVYALAVVRRDVAAKTFALERDRHIALAKACVKAGDQAAAEKRESDALQHYVTCSAPLVSAWESEALTTAISVAFALPKAEAQTLVDLERRVEQQVQLTLRRPVSSYDDAVDLLAIQLSMQGLEVTTHREVLPLTYSTTAFSSSFGRQLAADLETSLAATKNRSDRPLRGPVIVQGSFSEMEDVVRVAVTIRNGTGGHAVGGAKVSLPKVRVPKTLSLRPPNYEAALEDSTFLAENEGQKDQSISLELWTAPKGAGTPKLVYRKGDRMQLFVRVDRPAWVRIFYLMVTGDRVPLEEGFFVSNADVAVAYPHLFEVTPPFGVEHIFAVATTQRLPPLVSRRIPVGDHAYSVVRRADLLAHRESETVFGEARWALTTTP